MLDNSVKELFDGLVEYIKDDVPYKYSNASAYNIVTYIHENKNDIILSDDDFRNMADIIPIKKPGDSVNINDFIEAQLCEHLACIFIINELYNTKAVLKIYRTKLNGIRNDYMNYALNIINVLKYEGMV